MQASTVRNAQQFSTWNTSKYQLDFNFENNITCNPTFKSRVIQFLHKHKSILNKSKNSPDNSSICVITWPIILAISENKFSVHFLLLVHQKNWKILMTTPARPKQTANSCYQLTAQYMHRVIVKQYTGAILRTGCKPFEQTMNQLLNMNPPPQKKTPRKSRSKRFAQE